MSGETAISENAGARFYLASELIGFGAGGFQCYMTAYRQHRGVKVYNLYAELWRGTMARKVLLVW